MLAQQLAAEGFEAQERALAPDAGGRDAKERALAPDAGGHDAKGGDDLAGFAVAVLNVSRQLSRAFAAHQHPPSAPGIALPHAALMMGSLTDLAQGAHAYLMSLMRTVNAHVHVLPSGTPSGTPLVPVAAVQTTGREKKLSELAASVQSDLAAFVSFVRSHIHPSNVAGSDPRTPPDVMRAPIDLAPLAPYSGIPVAPGEVDPFAGGERAQPRGLRAARVADLRGGGDTKYSHQDGSKFDLDEQLMRPNVTLSDRPDPGAPGSVDEKGPAAEAKAEPPFLFAVNSKSEKMAPLPLEVASSTRPLLRDGWTPLPLLRRAHPGLQAGPKRSRPKPNVAVFDETARGGDPDKIWTTITELHTAKLGALLDAFPASGSEATDAHRAQMRSVIDQLAEAWNQLAFKESHDQVVAPLMVVLDRYFQKVLGRRPGQQAMRDQLGFKPKSTKPSPPQE